MNNDDERDFEEEIENLRDWTRQTGGTMNNECAVCGEDHAEETHGEPTTILQPSLHNEEDWADLLLDEAESYGANVDDTRKMLAESEDEERFDWAIEEARSALADIPGIFVVNEDDSFLVYDNRK